MEDNFSITRQLNALQGGNSSITQQLNVSLSYIDDSKIAYAVFDGFMGLATVLGNLLIVVAFWREPVLRCSTTNFYIFSLAVVDLLVGVVGMPTYIYSMLTSLPAHFESCLMINMWILTLCTISILHLLALSLDRYTVIVMMTRLSQAAKEKRARLLIGCAWILGGLIGCMPLMGWNMGPSPYHRCVFIEIIDFSYLVFLYYLTIITPTCFMVFFYIAIYRTVRKHDKQGIHNRSLNKQKLKLIARQRKIIFSLVLVIMAFLICWYPLYTLNAISYYCPTCYIDPVWFYISIVLSHLSSAINPLIYAYTMPGFKEAFVRVMKCQRPLEDRRVSMATASAVGLLAKRNSSSGNAMRHLSNPNLTPVESSNLLTLMASTRKASWYTDEESGMDSRRGSNSNCSTNRSNLL